MPIALTPKQFRRAIIASEKAMKPHRALRVENDREYWGRFYPHKRSDDKRRHFNLIDRAVTVLTGHLARRNPLTEVETDDASLDGEAALLSLYIDRLNQRLNRRKISREVLQDALLGPMGIVRSGERVSGELVTIQGRQYDRGAPFLRRVSLDCYGCDMQARVEQEMRFEYEVYPASRTMLLECGLFNPAVIERLPSTAEARRKWGERQADQRAGDLSEWERNELVEEVELIDIALYGDGETYMITMPYEEGFDGDFLRVTTFDGPDRGPFRKLCFKPINGQLIGLPPVCAWREQADAFYAITEKIVREAEKSKRVIAAALEVPEDEVDMIRDADDMDVVYTTDPAGIATHEFGGIMKDLFPVADMFQGWFNQASNNSDILSGANAGTDKATIYSGMQQNASAGIEDLSDIHEEFESECTRDFAFYGLADPLVKLPMTYRTPGGEFFRVTYDAQARRGDFDAYRFRIRPRSMQSLNPVQRSAALTQALQTILMAAQVTASTGGYINVGGVAKVQARETDFEDLELIVNDPALQMQQQQIHAMMPGPAQGVPQQTPGLNQAGASYSVRPDGQMSGGMQGPGMGLPALVGFGGGMPGTRMGMPPAGGPMRPRPGMFGRGPMGGGGAGPMAGMNPAARGRPGLNAQRRPALAVA